MAIQQVTINTKFDAWKDITNAIIDALGDNTALSTTDKTTLVAAVNEVLTKLGDITALSTTDKASAVAAVNEVLDTLGDISSLDGTFLTINNTVDALNNLVTRIGDLTSLNTTAQATLVSALNEVLSELGDISTLTTTSNASGVAAINELDSDIGDLTSLNTVDQSSIVAALNEVDQDVGDVNARIDNEVGTIANLDTTDKSSTVAAINEIEDKKLESLAVDYNNLLTNHGRFSAETTKILTTFDATMSQMTPYNTAVYAAGDRFLYDNSNYGGAGGALGTDIGSLMTTLQLSGRTDNRYGYEFFICDITMGGGTGDPEVFNVNNYYPFADGVDEIIGQVSRIVTFQAWVRLKTCFDEPTFDGILLGDSSVSTWVDGVPAAQQSILAVSGGWTHVRQTAVLVNEYKKIFPAIYASNQDVIQIALPSLYSGSVDMGEHLGVM